MSGLIPRAYGRVVPRSLQHCVGRSAQFCPPGRSFSSSCSRWFNFSASRSASRKIARPPTREVQSKSQSASLNANRVPGTASYNPLIQQLASRSSPILIYQSENKAPYVTGCFVLGGICVAYALSNGWTIVFDPLIDPSTFVKVTFGVVCTAMLGFGCALFYKTFRIIRSVTIVPFSLPNGQRSLRLRLESGNLRSKVVDVPYDAVSTSKRLFVPQTVLTGEERLRSIDVAKKRHEWERQRIMTLPFRQTGNIFSRFFRGFKSVVSDDEWIFLRAKGYRGRWKLYERPAWALRQGKHLDDLTRRM